MVGGATLVRAAYEEQRELLEDICQVRAAWEQEIVAERQPTRATDRRLSELVSRWQRRFPESRLFDCRPGGYCYSLCPAIQHPGSAGFPPVVAAAKARCAPALAPDDACARLKKQACADGSYLCAQAEVLADYARCYPKDDLLAVLARESCGGYLANWKGEALPAKPYVSTAGDPAWCSRFASPPPECGGAPAPTPTPPTPESFCGDLSRTDEQRAVCLRCVTAPLWHLGQCEVELRQVFPQFNREGRATNEVTRVLFAMEYHQFTRRQGR
ncbi:hypothetical protein KF840_02720 [bacterium]|nr:hypothetical protein [bacterium]